MNGNLCNVVQTKIGWPSTYLWCIRLGILLLYIFRTKIIGVKARLYRKQDNYIWDTMFNGENFFAIIIISLGLKQTSFYVKFSANLSEKMRIKIAIKFRLFNKPKSIYLQWTRNLKVIFMSIALTFGIAVPLPCSFYLGSPWWLYRNDGYGWKYNEN